METLHFCDGKCQGRKSPVKKMEGIRLYDFRWKDDRNDLFRGPNDAGGRARGTERLSDVDSRTVAQGAEPRPAKAVAPPGAPGALLVLTCTGPHASVSGIFLP